MPLLSDFFSESGDVLSGGYSTGGQGSPERGDLLWRRFQQPAFWRSFSAVTAYGQDGWRESWWIAHRRAAVFLVGPSALRPPRNERRAAMIQLLFGFVLLGPALLELVR
jgi:hypothetical protein